MTWEGRAPTAYYSDTSGHHLEFIGQDTVRLILREFDRELGAFAAFSEKANPKEMNDGTYRERNSLGFYHGRFLGEIQSAQAGLMPANLLKTKLVFQGEELFLKPEEFQSFPLIGRIPKSERVILRHFLGKNWPCPVFSVQYRCHGDTATAFRAFASSRDSSFSWISGWEGKVDTLSRGKEIHFQGQNEMREPLLFWVFSENVMGMVGCYDPTLALVYAQKMQKMTVLLPDP